MERYKLVIIDQWEDKVLVNLDTDTLITTFKKDSDISTMTLISDISKTKEMLLTLASNNAVYKDMYKHLSRDSKKLIKKVLKNIKLKKRN